MLSKTEIMNELNRITLTLGYNKPDRLFHETESSIMNTHGKLENNDFLLFSSNNRIICYINERDINHTFRLWLASKGYVLDNNQYVNDSRYIIDTPMHLKSFTVIPQKVLNRKYYISAMDNTENSCIRTFNGNFTE